MKKKLKALVVFDSAGPPPPDQDFSKMFYTDDWLAESDVVESLERLGHEVRTLGVYDDIGLVLQEVKTRPPDIIFNLTEVFNGQPTYDMNIVAFFELLGIPYTGASSPGLMLCKNKGVSKEILSYHRIKTPAFKVIRRGERIYPSKKLKYPVLIKPLSEEASYGISLNSLVDNDQAFSDRVAMVHESMGCDVIAEEYIHGRELYVSLLGTKRIKVFPFRELVFENMPDDEPKIATFKAKWDENYREKYGIKSRFALPLSEGVPERITKICKKVYRLLYMQGYARIDLRLTPENEIVILEANPNPYIAKDDEFGLSAIKGGYKFDDLIQKIVNLGLIHFNAQKPSSI